MKRLLALAPLVVALGACSNDSADTQATATADTGNARAAYVAEADGVCAEILANNPELVRSVRTFQQVQADDPQLIPKAAKHFALVLKVASDFSDDFTSIEPPAADRERIDELNETNDEAIEILASIVDELEAGRSPDAQFRDYGETLAKANRLAEAYGFEVCARISTG